MDTVPRRRFARTSAFVAALIAGLAITLSACGGGSDQPAPPAEADIEAQAGAQAETQAEAQAQSQAEVQAQPAPSPEPSEEPTAEEPPAPPAPDESTASLRLDLLIELTDPVDAALIRELGETVAERRGLPLLRDVPAFLIRRDDILTYFDADLQEEDVRLLDIFETTFRLLGLLDDEDLLELERALFEGLVLGFYEPELELFVVVSSNDHVAGRDIDTITHEFVHALQDQHFDLDAKFDAVRDNSDAILAFQFLVEGDATISESLFLDIAREFAGRLEVARDVVPGTSAAIPAALERIFIAPYSDGAFAIALLVQEHGQGFIDELLANPPDSTEQLIHLEKLLEREAPIAVTTPDLTAALAADWRLLGHDTLGEFIIAMYLDEEIGGGSADKAAAGWGGDRLSIYRDAAGDELLAWRMVWDSPEDGAEFFDAYVDWLERRADTVASSAEDGEAFALDGERSIWLRGDGAESWIVIGTDATTVNEVRRLILGGGGS